MSVPKNSSLDEIIDYEDEFDSELDDSKLPQLRPSFSGDSMVGVEAPGVVIGASSASTHPPLSASGRTIDRLKSGGGGSRAPLKAPALPSALPSLPPLNAPNGDARLATILAPLEETTKGKKKKKNSKQGKLNPPPTKAQVRESQGPVPKVGVNISSTPSPRFETGTFPKIEANKFDSVSNGMGDPNVAPHAASGERKSSQPSLKHFPMRPPTAASVRSVEAWSAPSLQLNTSKRPPSSRPTSSKVSAVGSGTTGVTVLTPAEESQPSTARRLLGSASKFGTRLSVESRPASSKIGTVISESPAESNEPLSFGIGCNTIPGGSSARLLESTNNSRASSASVGSGQSQKHSIKRMLRIALFLLIIVVILLLILIALVVIKFPAPSSETSFNVPTLSSTLEAPQPLARSAESNENIFDILLQLNKTIYKMNRREYIRDEFPSIDLLLTLNHSVTRIEEELYQLRSAQSRVLTVKKSTHKSFVKQAVELWNKTENEILDLAEKILQLNGLVDTSDPNVTDFKIRLNEILGIYNTSINSIKTTFYTNTILSDLNNSIYKLNEKEYIYQESAHLDLLLTLNSSVMRIERDLKLKPCDPLHHIIPLMKKSMHSSNDKQTLALLNKTEEEILSIGKKMQELNSLSESSSPNVTHFKIKLQNILKNYNSSLNSIQSILSESNSAVENSAILDFLMNISSQTPEYLSDLNLSQSVKGIWNNKSDEFFGKHELMLENIISLWNSWNYSSHNKEEKLIAGFDHINDALSQEAKKMEGILNEHYSIFHLKIEKITEDLKIIITDEKLQMKNSNNTENDSVEHNDCNVNMNKTTQGLIFQIHDNYKKIENLFLKNMNISKTTRAEMIENQIIFKTLDEINKTITILAKDIKNLNSGQEQNKNSLNNLKNLNENIMNQTKSKISTMEITFSDKMKRGFDLISNIQTNSSSKIEDALTRMHMIKLEMITEIKKHIVNASNWMEKKFESLDKETQDHVSNETNNLRFFILKQIVQFQNDQLALMENTTRTLRNDLLDFTDRIIEDDTKQRNERIWIYNQSMTQLENVSSSHKESIQNFKSEITNLLLVISQNSSAEIKNLHNDFVLLSSFFSLFENRLNEFLFYNNDTNLNILNNFYYLNDTLKNNQIFLNNKTEYILKRYRIDARESFEKLSKDISFVFYAQNETLMNILEELSGEKFEAIVTIKDYLQGNTKQLNQQNVTLNVLNEKLVDIGNMDCGSSLIKSEENLDKMSAIFFNFSHITRILQDKVLEAFPNTNESNSCVALELQEATIHTTANSCSNTTGFLSAIIKTMGTGNNTCIDEFVIEQLSVELSSLKYNMEIILSNLNFVCNCTEMVCPNGEKAIPISELVYKLSSNGGTEFFIAFSNTIGATPNIFITSVEGASGISYQYILNSESKTEQIIVRESERKVITLDKSLILDSKDGPYNKVVYTKADKEVSVFGWIGGDRGDGFLALPLPVWGTKYIAASFKPEEGVATFKSQIVVVGHIHNTFVSIKLKNPSASCSSVYEFTLDSQEAYLVECAEDLTGTEIASTATVSVLSGVFCASVPVEAGECQQFVEQLPPTNSWGNRFVIKSTHGDLIRIISSEENTETMIKFHNGTNSTINLAAAGDHDDIDISSGDLIVIHCFKPCLVVRFTKYKKESDETFMPTMMLVPAIEQFSKEISVIMPYIDESYATKHFIQIVSNYKFAMINETVYADGASWKKAPDSEYYAVVLQVNFGTHVVKAKDGYTIGVTVYGYGTTSYNSKSYGYPGGFVLKHLDKS